MPRKLRENYPGQIVHITSHANRDENLFVVDSDRVSFLQILEQIITKYQWNCFAHCLMGNHYHLLIELEKDNLSAGMCELNGKYARYFNKTHNKRGRLFRERYDDKSVVKETHFLELCRYIVLNPVEEGWVDHPSEWRWSSYRATVGEEVAPSFLNVEGVLQNFSNALPAARREYEKFVLAKVATTNLLR